MVAYSFRSRFVVPIQVGLGMVETIPGTMYRPKLQTIRAHRGGRSRHARPGEKVQLYCGQRSKSSFLIGEATCVETQGVSLHFRQRRRSDWVRCARFGKIDRPHDLDRFAQGDGFQDWAELREFWRAEHPGIDDFDGVIIFWKP